ARGDVADGERLGVAHVQVAAGVGEHVQRVAPFAAVVLLLVLERFEFLPAGLPFVLDRPWVVPVVQGGVPPCTPHRGAAIYVAAHASILRFLASSPAGPRPAPT